MRIAILGKSASVTHWPEDCAAGLTEAGHEVRFLATRDPRLSPAIDRLLVHPMLGAPRAAMIVRALQQFAPDLILAVAGFSVPPEILARVAAMPNRPPLVAWVGDAFKAEAAALEGIFDLIAYTDSAFIAAHRALHFATRCVYLPHAANMRLGGEVLTAERAPRLVFVANPTPQRRALLADLRMPVALVGPGWQQFDGVQHVITPRRVGVEELAAAYRGHVGVLNIRHEVNVLSGLNQRSFDPYLLGTPVVSDDQPDLTACFDEGSEVLVYRSPAELDAISERLGRDPAVAVTIGEAGRRRVLAEHRYQHRIARIAAEVL